MALGLLYLQAGQHAAAFEQLGTAMAFEPNNTKAVLAAGSVAQASQVGYLSIIEKTFFPFQIEKKSIWKKKIYLI